MLEDRDGVLTLVGSALLCSSDCDDCSGANAVEGTKVTTDGVNVLLAGGSGVDDGAAIVVIGPLAAVVGPATTLAGCNATGGS